MGTTAFFFLLLMLSIGMLIGYVLRIFVALGRNSSIELRVREEIVAARDKAQKLLAEAKAEIARLEEKHEEKMAEEEQKLSVREERIDKREMLVEKREQDTEEHERELRERRVEIEGAESEHREKEAKLHDLLQNIAGMSREEALHHLLREVERQEEETLTVHMAKIDRVFRTKLEDKARGIILNSLERLSQSVVADATTTAVELPDEETKGKIIGKEGRNIKAFERATGVELLIDDTPDTVILSTFDPIRREIARKSLERLIEDGRIQPAKIEEEVERARSEVRKIIKEKGEEAIIETGVYGLDSRIVTLLGQLHFRTSYGQNVLAHSIQASLLAGMIAEELGIDIATTKAAALVHDIGKAIDHQVPGSHVQIGVRILKKFNAPEEVILAMQSHHNDVPHATAEAYVVQAADAISASRPGARRENFELYLKRLSELEAIATSFTGVERAYAIEAGREVRVFVRSTETSDLQARNIARNIALRIEQEIRFPGEIKINVIRETRSIEYAR